MFQVSAYGSCSRTMERKGVHGAEGILHKCSGNDRVKCCNYGGEHSAAFQGCVVQKRDKYKDTKL